MFCSHDLHTRWAGRGRFAENGDATAGIARQHDVPRAAGRPRVEQSPKKTVLVFEGGRRLAATTSGCANRAAAVFPFKAKGRSTFPGPGSGARCSSTCRPARRRSSSSADKTIKNGRRIRHSSDATCVQIWPATAVSPFPVTGRWTRPCPPKKQQLQSGREHDVGPHRSCPVYCRGVPWMTRATSLKYPGQCLRIG